MSQKGCPPVKVNYDEIVEAARKAVLADLPGRDAPVEAEVNQVSGLGAIRLVEAKIDATEFILGFVTVPSVVNFATKLMQVGVIFPQVDLAVSRSILEGVTLIGTLLSGGKSFILGSFLGQFPSTLDAITDVAVAAVTKARAGVPGAAAKGMGQAREEEEVMKLRRDLERMSGAGNEEEMEGVLRVA